MRFGTNRSVPLYQNARTFVPCILGRMDTAKIGRSPGRQAEAARNDRRILWRRPRRLHPRPESADLRRRGTGRGRHQRALPALPQQGRVASAAQPERLRRYLAGVEAALAYDGRSLGRVRRLHAPCTRRRHQLVHPASGRHIHADQAHWHDGEKAFQLNTRLLDRTKSAGVLRQEFGVGDLSLVFEQELAAIKVGDQERTAQLRPAVPGTPARRVARYLRRAATGTAAELGEISRRWEDDQLASAAHVRLASRLRRVPAPARSPRG